MGLINRLRDSFYNTTNETGEDLKEHRERAISQEEAIESLYRSHPDRAIGPWQVEKLIEGEWPITSIRRAITNLTKRGVLVKTDHKRRGRHGRPEYMWQLNPSMEAQP